ncbi:MAG: hypothetical protein LBU22_05955 [Dysgonamonadaceae bacterium]|jgi:hypothetical protein|nr:hypothetical protein [Dysgonamonadaceae bacterium]
MREYIKKYLSILGKEIKDKIKTDINLDKPLFADFQIFDFVNFYLIREYILNDKSEKKDFFIGIPEKEFRQNFFNSILNSLTIIKLYQNFFNYKKTTPALNVNDLIYTKRNKESRILEVKKIVDKQIYLNYKYKRKNEDGICDFPLTKNIFTKLNPNLVENKNTVKDIDNYKSFLNEYFGIDFPLLTDFQNRTLIIAEKDFFKECGFLPIKYTAKSGNISNKLPFFNYMIDCYNDFQTAKKYLTNSSYQFDEILIIGDSKYRDSFSDILQELKWQGRVKNIILIGTHKPDLQNDFMEWLWSKDEIKIANNETPQVPQKQVIEDAKLLEKTLELKSEIDLLKKEKNIDISFLLKYTNFYFRTILTDSPLSKGTYQEYCDRLLSFFKSEKFEDELNTQFYNRDIYNPEIIKEGTKKIFNKFQKISICIGNQNLKWNHIAEKAKELGSKKLFLIVDKKSYSVLWNQIKNSRITNIRLIPDKRIDNQIDYLQSWINADDKNIANRTYIIPYLNNMEMFDTLSLLKGNVEVLCYKDIDEIAVDNLVQNYHSQEKSKLTHKDRKPFVSSVFSEDIQYLQRQLDDLFNFDLNNESFRTNPYESIDLPKEKILYEIEFEDGSNDKFESSKGIFLIDGNEQISSTIGEVYEGATIRFYQNDNKKLFQEVLNILDSDNTMNIFDYYADSWKKTLKNILSQRYNNSIKIFYKKLFNSDYKIRYNTFRLYFKDDCETRFPDIETLELICRFCNDNGFSNELISKELDRFIKCKRIDFSIRNRAGKNIGDDLIEYENSGYTEKSEYLQELPEDVLQKLLQTVQTKTIKIRTLLEYE